MTDECFIGICWSSTAVTWRRAGCWLGRFSQVCTQTMKMYAPVIASNCVTFKCRAAHVPGIFKQLFVSVCDAVRFNPGSAFMCRVTVFSGSCLALHATYFKALFVFCYYFHFDSKDALRNSKQPDLVICGPACDEHASMFCLEKRKQFLIQKIFLLYFSLTESTF